MSDLGVGPLTLIAWAFTVYAYVATIRSYVWIAKMRSHLVWSDYLLKSMTRAVAGIFASVGFSSQEGESFGSIVLLFDYLAIIGLFCACVFWAIKRGVCYLRWKLRLVPMDDHITTER